MTDWHLSDSDSNTIAPGKAALVKLLNVHSHDLYLIRSLFYPLFFENIF